MDEKELEVMLEKEEVVFEDRDEDINGNEQGILCGLLEDFATHEGSARLVSNYKVVVRVLEDPSRVDAVTLKTALKVISEGLNVSREEVTAAGEDVTKLSREQWKAARKSSITLLFLFFKAVTNIESKYFAEQQNMSVVAAVQATKRRGGKKNAAVGTETSYPFWEEYRQRLMIQMHRLLKCPIEKMWPAATNFFRGVTLAVCTVIQNPAAKLMRNMDLVDCLFDVLGQLCSRYEEQPGVINRLMPMITSSEDTARVIAHGLNRLYVNYERDRIIFHAVKEVLQQYNTQLGRETPAERSVAAFLHEVALLNPKATVSALPFVVQFLESDSSTIRGAVLGVCSELMTWSKTPEQNGEPIRQEEVHGDTDLDALRDDVLHYLVLHIRDTNALVRNKALQLCTKLVQQHSLYIPEVVQVAEQAKRRLMDKAVTTRKCAINLLTAAVYIDPIVIKFSVAEFKKQIRQSREELIETLANDLPLPKKILTVLKEFMELVRLDGLGNLKLPENIREPEAALDHVKSLLQDGSIYEACKFLHTAFQEFTQHPDFKPFAREMNSKKMYLTLFKKLLDMEIQDPDDEDRDEEDGIEDAAVIESEQCKQKRFYIKYLENCHDLAVVMESALPSMTILLELGNAADKTEVIECFAVLTESGYHLDTRVMGGIIDAIGQLDSAGKSEMLEYFWRIFLKGCSTDDRVVRRLFGMLDQLKGSQREHMASIVDEMVKSKNLVQDHFQVLWDAYGLSNPAWKAEDSKYAALILGIVGRTHVSVITSNIPYLIDVGLGPRGLEDYHLVQHTLEALMLLCPKPPKNPEEDTDVLPPMRFAMDHVLYVKLADVIIHGFTKASTATVDHAFQKVSELVFQLIYRTCMEPKKIILDLLAKVHSYVSGPDKQESEISNTERLLCRYLNIVTALLGAHVFYYENVVLSEVKRRKKLATSRGITKSKQSKKTSKVNVSKSASRSKNVTLNSTVSSQRSVASTPSNTSEISEMDVIIGNIGYDAELETIRGYLEKILMEPGVFKQMRTHTLFVCSRLDKFKGLQLKIAAVRALAKIMSISTASVARNADILLGLWKMVKSPEVKCEILRAAVLLNVRYPNQMERCNSCFLEGLTDKEDCIRIATLDFVTFLALNDLVKIREQLTEVALCLIDENVDVKEMAKDFLKQCGEKDNMLSNALPDILSRLSTRKDFPQESFQEIMKFLLEIVKKDKILVGFIEKLVLRFRVASKGRECQDVAFCLNQLSYNDKSFKVIKENLTAFQDKLGDELVFDTFNSIVLNLKKTAKPDFKIKLDEFESDIVAARAKCIEKERMEEAAVRKAVAGAPPQNSSSDSEIDADEGQENDAEQDNAEVDDSDKENDEDQNPNGMEETEESETEEVPAPPSPASRTTRNTGGRNASRSQNAKKSAAGRGTGKVSSKKTTRRVKAEADPEPESDDHDSGSPFSSSSEEEPEENVQRKNTTRGNRSGHSRRVAVKGEASSSDDD